ncbi:hypothetical protein [Mailhella massiliensis]|uniref:hypothetical protein n=1 Tax=Mailhella massiliensis TaxID=1903261 RepID=UPI00097D7CA4|nr:hypothetical protein [Mailhella massiliensis]
MQIDTNTLLYILFALLGVGWKLFTGWTKRVDGKLDKLSGRELFCTNKFMTKEEYKEGKEHVWSKFEEHDELFSRHDERLRALEQKR